MWILLQAIFKRLDRLYGWLYTLLCGRHPNLRPWHHQWGAVHALRKELRETLPLFEGRVLVVGAGSPRDRASSPRAREFVTVAPAPGPGVTLLVQPNAPWPLPSASFDALLCIDALATLPDADHAATEMARLLRPGGMAVVSVPALVAGDATLLRCYTAEGLRTLLNDHFTIATLRHTGGIGSTLALLVLGWLEALARQSPFVRLLQFVFLPLWLAFCGALNLAAVVVDTVDPTHAFYTSVLVVGVRKSDTPKVESELRLP